MSAQIGERGMGQVYRAKDQRIVECPKEVETKQNEGLAWQVGVSNRMAPIYQQEIDRPTRG